MKRTYSSPMILLSSTGIDINASQQGEIGTGDVAGWVDFWSEVSEIVLVDHPEFDPNDPDTWPWFFNKNDPGTWEDLLGDW